MSVKQVSVLGCGWLGLPLAKQLVLDGFRVNGSTTTKEKLARLNTGGINPFLIDLDALNKKHVCDFLSGSMVVIINIPPRRKIKEVKSYSKVLISLLSLIEENQKVIFVSSTSVYQNTNGWVYEDIQLNPATESGKSVLEAEKSLQNYLGDRLTIVRFSGLVGKNRHPGKFLAGRKDLPNANATVNMIHQEDCIGLISKIIEDDFWGEVINGVATEHPLREDFYTLATQSLKLISPTFKKEEKSTYKLVSNVKSVNELGYCYLYDNPIDMI